MSQKLQGRISLVIVDLQNDFLSPQGAYARGKTDFAPGSWGQANVDALTPLVDVAVCKVAYSAFFNTQLDWILRRAGINTVVVCGIVTNGGVASTVRDAHMRDYQTVVLSDGCATFTEVAHQAALIDMSSVAQVMTCNQFLATL